MNTNKTRPKAYCPTRFVEGAETVFTFLELHPALLEYFERRREISIANTLTDPAFFVSLHLVRSVLGETKGLSTQLQAKAIDLVRATAEVERVIERLSTSVLPSCCLSTATMPKQWTALSTFSANMKIT